MHSTGIPGLDNILGGGLAEHRIYLIAGEPGSCKTTTGMRFMLEGARCGEHVLNITLAESLSGMLKLILGAVERIKPNRVVLDSLSKLQLLADSPLRCRRKVLALKQFFAKRQCTVVLLDDRTSSQGDLQVRSIAHGVIQLDHAVTDYGSERRCSRVVKYRGQKFAVGMHDYTLVRGGLEVHPRLVASQTRSINTRHQISSGLSKLDTLLGVGVEEGASTLMVGPPGTGKSSLSAQFVAAANQRGEMAAMLLFAESVSNLLHRGDGLNKNPRASMKSGLLTIQQIDPAELTPGQFSAAILAAVHRGAKMGAP